MKKLLRWGWIGSLSILPLLIVVELLLWIGSLIYQKLIKFLSLTDDNIVMFSLTLSGIFLSVAFIFYIGYIVEKRGKIFILDMIEKIFQKLPLIKSLYQFLKDFFKMFILDKERSIYKNAVMINFPNKELYSIGFATKEIDDQNTMVFIPTAPNPTNGFTVIVDKNSVKVLDIPIEEALKLIISVGSVSDPDTYLKLAKNLKDKA